MRNSARLFLTGSLVAAFLFCQLRSFPQTEGPPVVLSESESDEIRLDNIQIVMELNFIQMSFVVRDPAGNIVPNLSASDFRVAENGVDKSILSLREEEVPVSAVIMLDCSWSVDLFLPNVLEAAVDFARGLRQDSASLVAFSESPRVIFDWDEIPAEPEVYLRDVKTEGKTALYDSVIWVARNRFRNQTGKKMILLLSDGIDTVSRATFSDMVQETRKRGVTLYPIIYTNAGIERYRRRLHEKTENRRTSLPPVSENFHRMISVQNDFVQQALSHGGRTIFSHGFTDLRGIYEVLIDEMRRYYVLAYQSDNPEQVADRKVTISTRREAGSIYVHLSSH